MSEDFPYLPPLVPDDKTVCESVPSGSGEQLPIIAAKTGVTIGTDFDRRVPVTVADREREGGVYILGQPRTGKSTLLVSMALQDITNGHGLLFIDPHTDAIQDLLARIPQERLKDVIFLDPTDKTRSFGINLLHCTDPTNPLAIEDTWGRLRDIFVKLWEQETRQLGFWIDKILRNSVYLLVETDAYTIVEMPLLLDEDTTFRNRLLEKVAVKPFVKDFWYKDFDRLTRRDRTEQVDPALNRLGRFRDNEYLRSIVGQTQTDSTLDFQKIMADEKIVLLLLPENLTSDVKDAIGTIVLSELLYAANERAALRAEDRRYFGVYCDEFQQFATPDFARLFTQTGKFGVMPVVAHQTREQFKSRDDPNRGATAASRTKVFFTLSPHDAREMPLVFAKEPPTETKREEKYAISQTPVYHLLRRGHDDPLIRAFVDAHLRPLQYEIEDIWDDIKAEELLRRDFLDQAALDRIEERISWVDERGRTTPAILGRAAAATQQARLQTTRIESILETGRTLKQSVRDINRFLTTVMEGKSVSSQEDFSNFLIARTRASSAISNDDRTLLELYISLVYGDPQKPRGIPYAFACANPFLFSGETAALTLQLSSALDKARADCTERYLRQETQRWVNHDWYLRHRETFPYERHVPLSIQSKRFNDEEMRQKRASILESISGVRSALDVRSVYTCFVWLQCFPELEMLIAPYYTRRFKPRWSGNFNKRTVWFRERLERRFWKGYEEPDYVAFLSARVVSNLLSFLSRYGEGAYVALEMLVCATNGGPPINIYCGKADYYTPWCAGRFRQSTDAMRLKYFAKCGYYMILCGRRGRSLKSAVWGILIFGNISGSSGEASIVRTTANV